MFVVRPFRWDWECSVNKCESKAPPVHTPSKSVKVETTVQRIEGPKRLHSHLNLYLQEDGETIRCKQDVANLFWLIVLMEKGGFFNHSTSVVCKEKCLDIAKKAVEYRETMELIPLGEKEMAKEYHECIRILMTDDRIPVWNPIFERLLVATSYLNVITVNHEGKPSLIAPWKQRRDVLVAKSDERGMWTIETCRDLDVRALYPLASWLPKTKTACNAMKKDVLYLICTLFEIHPPKKTKKCMLELIGKKLKE